MSKKTELITDQYTGDLEIALNAAVSSGVMSEEQSTLIKEITGKLMGEQVVIIPILMSACAILLPPPTAIAAIKSLEPTYNMKTKQLLLEMIDGDIS